MAAEKQYPARSVSGSEIECCHCFCGSERECRTVSTRIGSIGRNKEVVKLTFYEASLKDPRISSIRASSEIPDGPSTFVNDAIEAAPFKERLHDDV
jgi:hypothetical protein